MTDAARSIPVSQVRRPERPTLSHHLQRMRGRNPAQSHRSATPLELLFDLTFVVAFGQAADQASHLFAEGHFAPALGGFGFAMAAVCWAWVNFTWFASAYDNDDWLFRLLTMVQMIGVLIVALGLPALFESLDKGEILGNDVMVAGYVVMRIPLVLQWVRAARQDPARRVTALTYAGCILVSQLGWVVLLSLRTAPVAVLVPVIVVVLVLDFGGPLIAERRKPGTPWHAHHIAERYGLLVIIALGESIFGTIATVSAIVQHGEWTTEAVLIVVAGTGLTFTMWWIYFIVPSGEILHAHRERSMGWAYSHIPLFASITATGAGLHVVAYVIEGDAEVGALSAVIAVAVPVFVFVVIVFVLYSWLVRAIDPFHLGLFLGTSALLAFGVVLAIIGASIGWCLLVIVAAPLVVVVGYEALGYRHEEAAMERALK